MAYSDDHIALAAEYALGTLDADERVEVETMIAQDPGFAAVVQGWVLRLGVLNQMVGAIEPRPIVWENIKAEIERAARAQQSAVLSDIAPPPVETAHVEIAPDARPDQEPPQLSEAQPPEPVPAEPDAQPDVAPVFVPLIHAPDPDVVRAPPMPVIDDGKVIRLESRVKRWRSIASAVGALAAALLVTLSLQIFMPDALPGVLRPAPRIQTVEVRSPAAPLAASAQYVALLQGQAGGPAFILTIDGATRNFTVRKVGASPEPGKSFELWLISDKLPRPRSLGVIGGGDFTARPLLAAYDPDVVNAATYAVTVEPAGGSPDGRPSSAPVFTGKLIETVPPSEPAAKN